MAHKQAILDTIVEGLYNSPVDRIPDDGEGTAQAILDELIAAGMIAVDENKPDVVTPTQGDMSQQDHTAFILRIFMYWVERQAAKQVTVDLRDVMARTRGRQLQVALQGHVFEARTIADLTLPTDEERRMMQ